MADSAGAEHEAARLLRELPAHGAATTVAFTPDGRYVATASHSASAKLWDVASGNLERTFISHDREIRSLAFSRDGVLLLTASDDRTGEPHLNCAPDFAALRCCYARTRAGAERTERATQNKRVGRLSSVWAEMGRAKTLRPLTRALCRRRPAVLLARCRLRRPQPSCGR